MTIENKNLEDFLPSKNKSYFKELIKNTAKEENEWKQNRATQK